ncbi:MAG TPA: PTS glucose/sucrose transporter subunit IIB [Nocardioides sp.]|uniref:PTS glucose/sucrose transporter subunit IIB n=1 Tax=Nocardioides sp. TaxID=35761 RepID=UPI002D808068|nr:PTS glucose/sucrose transporter subunit IIB [Nocardioides sp.]HET6652886.1 PTS glucose/sucrose transporter subunit IIB [Nocardioides sp.]
MSQAEQIVAGLGGSTNIVEIEACITRLRTALADTALVDETALQDAGAHGIMRAGSVVQVVVGPDADTIASQIEALL